MTQSSASDKPAPERESQRFYRHLRELWNAPRRQAKTHGAVGAEPYAPGRDPLPAGALLAEVTEQLGWQAPLAEHELFARWSEIVGSEVAAHSEPQHLENGQLTVKCDSTAWATQLRMLRHDIVSQLERDVPAAAVENIRFLGPDAPSWKKGPRATLGRGPRDTYG